MASHNCPHTPGLTCDEHNTSCWWCGWHPQEKARRMEMIQSGKLHKNPFGKQWLRLKASERS